MAHTSDGKSAFAKQLCEATARAGGGVIWYCGEDPEDATCERILGDKANIPSIEIGRLDINQKQLEKLNAAVISNSDWTKRIIPVFDAPSVDDVLHNIQETTTIAGAPVVFIVLDYIQIFGDSDNLEHEIARLAKTMNMTSGSRRIAMALFSQVSSDVYRRGRDTWNSTHTVNGFVPTLGDTEWCRRAEKSCKAVWSLFRPGRWLREMGEDVPDDMAELHVKKASFGPRGFETLGWDGPNTRFLNL